MADFEVCICGQLIRQRTWHDAPQWVHVQSGNPWCSVQRAEPRSQRVGPDD